jgi:hypothetical protein
MGVMMYEPKTVVVTSASDLSAYQYVFVKYSSGDNAAPVVALCGSTEVPMGIIIKGEIAGRDMEMIPLNNQPAKVVAAGVIAVGATCITAANGQAAATTTDGHRVFFIATEAAGAANDIIAGYTVNMFRGA